MMMIIIFS